jgi:1-acyl-sn-glycerol-3-phosphate acyltransferase
MTQAGNAVASSRLKAAARLSAVAALAAALAPVQAVLVRSAPRRSDVLARRFHRLSAGILGMRIRIHGRPSAERPTLYVANHASYLDVTVLGSALEACFVAKREVGFWPVIGALARLQRTVMIERRAALSALHLDQLRRRLALGDNLVLFPEGTSTAGVAVQPFRSTLFAAAAALPDGRTPVVQPVWIAYRALGRMALDAALRGRVAWYAEMTLAPHLVDFAGLGGVAVDLGFAPPVSARDFASRKDLAAHCRAEVAAGLAGALAGPAWWLGGEAPEGAAEGGLYSAGSGAILLK